MTHVESKVGNSEKSAEQLHMKLQQVSENCYAVLCEKNRVCDANSGLVIWAAGWSSTRSRIWRTRAG
jgi:hypothetical protein